MRVATNGIELELEVAGPADGPVVVLIHGFPELGYSWRHQLGPLADAGFRVVVPNLRGFDGSDAPEPVEAYAIDAHSADIVGLIDACGRDRAILVGHDWGADIAWKTALLHPERVRGVAGLSVPYAPLAPAPPISIMRANLGEDFYMVFFQEPDVPEAELERDVRRTLATTKQWSRTWTQDTTEDPTTPPHLTDAELQVYVDAFERSGFRGSLNLYRNIDRNWEIVRAQPHRTIDQPALFLTGSRDPVTAFMPSAVMTGHVTNLQHDIVIDGAGHWVNQERPDEVNAALLAFLQQWR